jgi:hypothetical protein
MHDPRAARHSVDHSQPDEVVFGETQRLAAYSVSTHELVWSGEDSGGEDQDDRVLIVACSADRVEAVQLGAALDSSAHVVLPTLDIDGQQTFSLDIYFVIGKPVLVILAGMEAIPRELLDEVVIEVANDLDQEDEDVASWKDLAQGSKWLLTQFLRQRIRTIEASVRAALADDAVSESDYAALREYPNRLALVEQLSRAIPDPTWESHRPAPLYGIATLSTPILANPAQEARDSSARLSGLISSQAVVLAQRQAADTERFQRLVTVVGATVLVPGLVAAVFGANVGFRGEDTTRGFWAMMILMASSGLGSYAFLRSRELGVWSGLAKSTLMRRLKLESPRVRLSAIAAVAVLGLTASISLLMLQP